MCDFLKQVDTDQLVSSDNAYISAKGHNTNCLGPTIHAQWTPHDTIQKDEYIKDEKEIHTVGFRGFQNTTTDNKADNFRKQIITAFYL